MAHLHVLKSRGYTQHVTFNINMINQYSFHYFCESSHYRGVVYFVNLKKFFFNVYLFFRERERQNASGLGQREMEAQNLKQAPGSEL